MVLMCKPSLEQGNIQGRQFPRFAVIAAVGASLFNKEVYFIRNLISGDDTHAKDKLFKCEV